MHYEVSDGHDWLILSSFTFERQLPANVSSSPAINLISFNKSIHYRSSGIDRQRQNVYRRIIKHGKILIGMLIQTTSKAATLLTVFSARELPLIRCLSIKVDVSCRAVHFISIVHSQYAKALISRLKTIWSHSVQTYKYTLLKGNGDSVSTTNLPAESTYTY